jgi:hypothetical protein
VRSFLVVTCLATFALGFGRSASAGLPPCCNSTVPSTIPVVGHDGSGLPDAIGEITVVVRDLANNPVEGAMVVLDFSNCTELRLCAGAHDPGVFVDCPTRTVRRLTDVNGRALFRVTGWSVATPGTPGAPYHSGKIYADGVLLGSPNVAIYDLDGNGLSAADLSAFLADFFSGSNPARSDYDDNGTVGANDLSKWLSAYFAGGSVANCSPEGPCP